MESLTEYQRLILINQLTILKHLEEEKGLNPPGHYDERIEILEKGYVHQYDILTGFLHPEVSQERYAEVVEILSMFRAFDTAIHRIGETALKNAGIDIERLRLKGFDGHGHMLYIAEHEIKDGKWSELRDLVFDSHTGYTDLLYEKMVKKFIARGNERYSPTIDDLLDYASIK